MTDTDGSSVEDIDMPKFFSRSKQCDLAHIWSAGLNCNSHHKDLFVDPRARDCRKNSANFEDLAKWLNFTFK